MISAIFEQSLLFFPLALGLFISYGTLRIADLTTDGSFVLGAAAYAILVHAGYHPAIATLFAAALGALAGSFVSLLQTKLSLNPLIAGILMVFILNTLTLKLMGKPNLSVFTFPSLFSSSKMMTLLFFAVFLIAIVSLLLASRVGLMLQAFGNHPTLLDLYGRSSHRYRLLGLSLSNGLVGLCGALTAQANGYADIGMGMGIVLVAIGTVILGQQCYKALFLRPVCPGILRLLCCFLGVILYFTLVNCLIALGLDPIYLKLMVGFALIGFLSLTQKKEMALS